MIVVNLQNVLSKTGLNAAQLAKKVKASGLVPKESSFLESYLYKVVRGERRLSLDMIDAILNVTGLELSDLVEYTPSEQKAKLVA